MDQNRGESVMIGAIQVNLSMSSSSATSFELVPLESLSRAENIPGSDRNIEHLGPRWGFLDNRVQHNLRAHFAYSPVSREFARVNELAETKQA